MGDRPAFAGNRWGGARRAGRRARVRSMSLAPLAFWALDDRLAGRCIFVAVFAVLVVWLLRIPSRRLWGESPPPWWRNVRVWAVAVAVIQVLVYAIWS